MRDADNPWVACDAAHSGAATIPPSVGEPVAIAGLPHGGGAAGWRNSSPVRIQRTVTHWVQRWASVARSGARDRSAYGQFQERNQSGGRCVTDQAARRKGTPACQIATQASRPIATPLRSVRKAGVARAAPPGSNRHPATRLVRHRGNRDPEIRDAPAGTSSAQTGRTVLQTVRRGQRTRAAREIASSSAPVIRADPGIASSHALADRAGPGIASSALAVRADQAMASSNPATSAGRARRTSSARTPRAALRMTSSGRRGSAARSRGRDAARSATARARNSARAPGGVVPVPPRRSSPAVGAVGNLRGTESWVTAACAWCRWAAWAKLARA